jgi:CubicO group peptidase (beta-lactamase class C family)
MTPGKIFASSIDGIRRVECEGLRNLEQPVNEQTACDLGSVTKIVATTSIAMKLVEGKTIALDDLVERYLPEWANYKRSGVTIGDLLEHQSGLREWQPLYISQANGEDARQIIASNGYAYDSGRHYSDLGFITLGNVITEVLGTDLDSAFKEWVSNPLGLQSTQYGAPVDRSDLFASSYGDRAEMEMIRTQVPYKTAETLEEFTQWRTHILEGEVNDGNAFHLYKGVSGHAGLFSTADDLLRFGEELLSSLQGEGYFDRKVLETFLTPGRDPMQGLGFRNWIEEDEIEYWGHTGFPGVTLAVSPHQKSVLVLLSNRLLTQETPEKTEDIFADFRSTMRNRYIK